MLALAVQSLIAVRLLPLLQLIFPPLASRAGEISFQVPPDAVLIPTAGGSVAPFPSQDGPRQWVPVLALPAGGAAAFHFAHPVAGRALSHWLGAALRRIGSASAKPSAGFGKIAAGGIA